MIQRSLLLMIQRSFCGYRSTKQDCLQIRYGIALTIFDRAPKRWRRCDLKGCKQWTTKWLNYTISIKWIRYTTVLLEKVCRIRTYTSNTRRELTWDLAIHSDKMLACLDSNTIKYYEDMNFVGFWQYVGRLKSHCPPSLVASLISTIVGTIPTYAIFSITFQLSSSAASTIVQHSLL